jgi:hypothetical protein
VQNDCSMGWPNYFGIIYLLIWVKCKTSGLKPEVVRFLDIDLN